MLLCSRQSILWRSKLRADPVLVFLLNDQSVLYDAVAMHFVLCFFPVVRPEMLGIMAGMDHEAGFAGFDVFPLARCFSWCLRPQMPVIMAGLDHRTVWSFTGAVPGQGFLHARCCATSVFVQTVLYTFLASPQLQFFMVVDSCGGTEAYSMQAIVFPSCSGTCVRRPLLCRLCSFPMVCSLGHTDDVPVVGNNRCFWSLLQIDVSVVVDAGSYGPDCSDEQRGRRLGYAFVLVPRV